MPLQVQSEPLAGLRVTALREDLDRIRGGWTWLMARSAIAQSCESVMRHRPSAAWQSRERQNLAVTRHANTIDSLITSHSIHYKIFVMGAQLPFPNPTPAHAY